jgi:TetR/AcrR family transcriptional repressor of mexCD-oprJ operon
MPEPMTHPAVDHRRATAQRNAAAILDATERLLAKRTPLSIVAIAAEAGVSRPTLYAHYKSIAEIIESAVERSVVASLAAFEEAKPDDGPADRALLRMADASWKQLGRYEALARGAAEYLTTRRDCTAPTRRCWTRSTRSSNAVAARAPSAPTSPPTGS